MTYAMKRKVIIFIFSLFTLTAKSQNHADLASINYSIGPIRSTYNQLYIAETNIQLGIPLKSGNLIPVGFSGSKSLLENENKLFEYELANLTFRLGYIMNFNEFQSLTVLAFNRYNSNEFKVGSSGSQLGGAVLFSQKISDTRTFKLGFYVNPEFFGPLFTPLLGFDWEMSDRARIYGTLPITATYQYKLNDRLYVGGYFNGLVSSYIQPQIGNFYVQRGFNFLSPYIDLCVTRQVVFQVRPGFLIGSKFKMYQKQDKTEWALSAIKIGDDRTVLSEINASGILLQAGLIYRYQFEK